MTTQNGGGEGKGGEGGSPRGFSCLRWGRRGRKGPEEGERRAVLIPLKIQKFVVRGRGEGTKGGRKRVRKRGKCHRQFTSYQGGEEGKRPQKGKKERRGGADKFIFEPSTGKERRGGGKKVRRKKKVDVKNRL